MTKKLIIITNEFPFGKRETFLESEIQVISRYFSHIIIIPCKFAPGLRELPNNATVDNTFANEYQYKFKWTIKSVFSSLTAITFIKYGTKECSIIFYKNLFKYCILSNLIKAGSKSILEENPGVTIYSYWFNNVVDVFSRMKDTFDFKLVTRAHRGDLYEEFSTLKFFPFREYNINKIDAVYSISEDGRQYLNDRFRVSNVHRSRLGVFDNATLTKKPTIGNISIVSVSNIIPVKRVGLIAESIILFANENLDLKISWNHFGHGPLANKILEFLEKNQPPNFNYKFHGVVSNSQILKYYSEHPVSLFINLSESEGIPVSIMEAISFGIPILATSVGGVSEIVNPNTGLTIESACNAAIVSKGISKLIEHSPTPETVKAFWLENFSAEKNFLEFSKSLINL
jgi:glycosyltransferase involved in cell wall biosynthesis